MAQNKYLLQVPKAGLNVDIGAVVQDYRLKALSIHGPYFAVGNGIDAVAGDFDPTFKALGIEKLRGSGERTGDEGDDRVFEITSVAGDILGLRIPDDHPTETAWFEITANKPF